MVYKIEIRCTAWKQMLSFLRQAQLEIAQAIDSLANIPRPLGCKKLQGKDLWRLKAGRYRVVYFIDDEIKQVIVIKIVLMREDTYRGF